MESDETEILIKNEFRRKQNGCRLLNSGQHPCFSHVNKYVSEIPSHIISNLAFEGRFNPVNGISFITADADKPICH